MNIWALKCTLRSPPALAELISNAYDADASTVTVEFLERNGNPTAITVYDNGTGMSPFDIQNKFLVIGRNRRKDDGDKPSKKYRRLPTGKKGLGKLALVGLAKDVSVETIKNGFQNKFSLDWDSLLSAEGVYNPKTVIDNLATKRDSGTTIQLSELKRKSSFDLEAIADSLSKIFIVDSTFQIILKGANEKKIVLSNDMRFRSVDREFQWENSDIILRDDPFRNKIECYFITAKTPIPPSSGLRGIAIFSRGKLVNLPEYFSESTSSHFYQYLTGWIKADFIDLLDEDVISTNRQSINWDNPEMMVLRKYLSQLITKVGAEWRRKRANKKNSDLEKATGIDKGRWLNSLPKDIRSSVETIVDQLGDGEGISETYTPVVKALYNLIPEYPLLHWRHLHPTIKDGVELYYRNEQYGHAADQGAKIYGQKILDLTGKDVDGVALADLFSLNFEKLKIIKFPVIQLSDLNSESKINIQEGQQFLTRGLIKGFRNPINHAPMSSIVPEVISELDCLNILSLISYLTMRLDIATVNLGPSS